MQYEIDPTQWNMPFMKRLMFIHSIYWLCVYIICLLSFQVVSSAIVDKYIGESARLIREMFNYARDHQPCIIFMDEIDAIGGRRFSEGTSADREIQRTLMELLNQMDGFDSLGQVGTSTWFISLWEHGWWLQSKKRQEGKW